MIYGSSAGCWGVLGQVRAAGGCGLWGRMGQDAGSIGHTFRGAQQGVRCARQYAQASSCFCACPAHPLRKTFTPWLPLAPTPTRPCPQVLAAGSPDGLFHSMACMGEGIGFDMAMPLSGGWVPGGGGGGVEPGAPEPLFLSPSFPPSSSHTPLSPTTGQRRAESLQYGNALQQGVGCLDFRAKRFVSAVDCMRAVSAADILSVSVRTALTPLGHLNPNP